MSATVTELDDKGLKAIPAVEHFERRGDRLVFTSQDTDQLARYLLTQTNAHDLEIASRGLEDAFIALTGGGDRDTEEQSS